MFDLGDFHRSGLRSTAFDGQKSIPTAIIHPKPKQIGHITSTVSLPYGRRSPCPRGALLLPRNVNGAGFELGAAFADPSPKPEVQTRT
jgi:hypothetical protein